ncbi:MAG: argininosuccinate synthase domain-containing protein [Acidobacteriota bacterium]
MRSTIVFAFDGDAAGRAAIAALAAEGVAVVALALDTGYGPALDGVREQARAAGARRCHVLDVRDEFARRVLVPALGSPDTLGPIAAAAPRLAAPLVAATLVEIARLEGASAVGHLPSAAPLAPLVGAVAPTLEVRVVGGAACPDPPRPAARRAGRPDRPATLEITFAAGEPTAINGVPLAPAELFDVVDTIAADHEIPLFVPQLAFRALAAAGSDSGTVHLRLETGRPSVTAVHPHDTASLVGTLR